MIAAAACAAGLWFATGPGTSPTRSTLPVTAPKAGPILSTPSASPRAETKPDFMYLPGIMYGDPKSKNLIAFYWSASQQASADNFNKYLAPLISKLLKSPSSSYAVLLYQILEDDKRDSLGPGGLLLCPNEQQQYEWLAVEYLKTAKDVAKRDPLNAITGDVHYINASVRQLADKYNIDLLNCIIDGKYNLRWAQAVGDSLGHDAKFKNQKLPFFAFDNAVVAPGDPRLEKLEQLAAQP